MSRSAYEAGPAKNGRRRPPPLNIAPEEGVGALWCRMGRVGPLRPIWEGGAACGRAEEYPLFYFSLDFPAYTAFSTFMGKMKVERAVFIRFCTKKVEKRRFFYEIAKRERPKRVEY